MSCYHNTISILPLRACTLETSALSSSPPHLGRSSNCLPAKLVIWFKYIKMPSHLRNMIWNQTAKRKNLLYAYVLTFRKAVGTSRRSLSTKRKRNMTSQTRFQEKRVENNYEKECSKRYYEVQCSEHVQW